MFNFWPYIFQKTAILAIFYQNFGHKLRKILGNPGLAIVAISDTRVVTGRKVNVTSKNELPK